MTFGRQKANRKKIVHYTIYDLQLLLQCSGACPQLQGMAPGSHLLHEAGFNLYLLERTPS